MINFLSVLSKDAVTPAAPSVDIPRNWRCELGTFWQDIEEAGSVVRAIRLRGSAASALDQTGDVEGLTGGESTTKVGRWAHFRTLCSSML